MRKTMFVVALALAVVSGACAADVTASDEYQALELEVADLEQQLTDLQVELSEARVLAHCRESLTNYKRPKYVEFVADIPKSPVGDCPGSIVLGLCSTSSRRAPATTPCGASIPRAIT